MGAMVFAIPPNVNGGRQYHCIRTPWACAGLPFTGVPDTTDNRSWPSKGRSRIYYKNFEFLIPNSSTIPRRTMLRLLWVPVIACRLLAQTVVGSDFLFDANNLGLCHHLVCTPLSSRQKTVDNPNSEDEIRIFWQAERRSRWSIARILFMMVGSCIC